MEASRVQESEIEKLQEYDLTEYEAKAYLALVELEEATAREVAEVSRVPRTKIYGVIDDLHEKSLVEVIPERPKRFLPQPFDQYLDRFEQRYQQRLEQIEKDRARFEGIVEGSGPPTIQGAGDFRVHKGRKNVLNKMLEMIEEADTSVWMLGSANAPLRLNYYSPLLHDKTDEEDVVARVQCPIEPRNRMDIEEARQYAGVRHRDSRASGSSVLAVDGSEVLLVHYIPDDTHLFKGEDVAIWTDDPAIVEDQTELLSEAWTGARTAEDRLDELPEVETETAAEQATIPPGTE
jgi:sugar-specific transcriptional regulator TrmB